MKENSEMTRIKQMIQQSNYRIKRQSPKTWGIFRDGSIVEGGFFTIEATKRALKTMIDEANAAETDGGCDGKGCDLQPGKSIQSL